jgi:DNA-binding XRE family transcriptional regulator
VLNLESLQASFFQERHLPSAHFLGALLVYVRWHAQDGRFTPASRAVGEAMRQAREALGLTQTQLAGQLGIGRITLSRQESGAQPPSRAQIYRWCRALGLVASTTAARGVGVKSLFLIKMCVSRWTLLKNNTLQIWKSRGLG